MIDKGLISTVSEDGKTATVVPAFAGSSVTFPLVVPFFLAGSLAVKMPVVYATFPDNTGIILARMDGEWSHNLSGGVEVAGGLTADTFGATGGGTSTGGMTMDSLTVTGNITVAGSASVVGNVSAADVVTGAASFNGHTHTYEKDGTGTGTTGGPQ